MPSLPKCNRCKIIIKGEIHKKIFKNDLSVDSVLSDGTYLTANLCDECMHDLVEIDCLSDLPEGDIKRYRQNRLWFD